MTPTTTYPSIIYHAIKLFITWCSLLWSNKIGICAFLRPSLLHESRFRLQNPGTTSDNVFIIETIQRAHFPNCGDRSDIAHQIYFRFDGLQDLPIHFNIRAHLYQFLCTQILKLIGQPSSPSDLLRSQFPMLYILQSNNKDWERLVHLNFHKQDRLQKPLDSEYLLHSKGVYKNRNETNFIQLKVNNAYIKKLISPDL